MKKNITFTLPAEAVGHSEATLLGDFNNWNAEHAPKLQKQSDGSFATQVSLEEGKTYNYRFLLSDGRWVNDYQAENYVSVPGMHIDNCVITVPVSTKKESAKSPVAKVPETKEKVSKAVAPAKVATPVKAVTPAKVVTPVKEKATPKAKTVAPVTKASPVKKVAAKVPSKIATPKAAAKKIAQPAKAAKKVTPVTKKK